jgi:hypothetical protein
MKTFAAWISNHMLQILVGPKLCTITDLLFWREILYYARCLHHKLTRISPKTLRKTLGKLAVQYKVFYWYIMRTSLTPTVRSDFWQLWNILKWYQIRSLIWFMYMRKCYMDPWKELHILSFWIIEFWI